jgi:PAS domain S-box-containing protein
MQTDVKAQSGRPEDALAIVHQTLIGEAIDCSPMLAFVADDNMRYVAVSSAVCDVLGYTRNELLKLRVPDVAFESTASAEFAEMVETGSRAGTAKLRTKDGQTVEFTYHAFETRITGLTFYLSFGVVTT